MKELVAIAEQVAARLVERPQTIAVAESSTGGLISASLLAVPGASAYFLGGGVIYANDELFADRENLIKPGDPVFQPHTFGNKGQVMDGWETRRRRETGSDSAIVRLGCAGVVRRVVVDTSYFTGNYPPEVAVEACGALAASLTRRRGRCGLGAARRLGSAPDRRTDCGSGDAFPAGFERHFRRRSACSRR